MIYSAEVAAPVLFLLRDMGSELRERVEADAEERDTSLAEVVRSILCERYGLECQPIEGWGARAHLRGETTTILLRLQPELFNRLKGHSRRFTRNKRSMRSLVIEALEAHYNGGVT